MVKKSDEDYDNERINFKQTDVWKKLQEEIGEVRTMARRS